MSNFVNIAGDVTNLFHHRSLVVGTSAIAFPNSITKLTRGIQIVTDATNAGIIYIGRSIVTANSAAETDGFPLSAAEGLFLPLETLVDLRAVASAIDQKLFWIAV